MTKYFSTGKSKDQKDIPIYKDSNTGREIFLHSKYNPEKEAESFIENVDLSCKFFIILGLAGGYHIKKLLDKVPDCNIIALENSTDDIEFLCQIPLVKDLSHNKRISFSSLDDLEKKILSLYKPALHGNLNILSLRQWENIFPEDARKAREIVKDSVKLLSGDYSVQKHFGKIWQKNIFENLSVAEKCLPYSSIIKSINTTKTAAIIAAGPSLNSKIEDLKKKRDDYFIIATDTAYSILSGHNIICDAVISIDGQQVSHQHYFSKVNPHTIFIFDLCANPSAVRKILAYSKKIIFAESGHPLSQYASLYSGKRNFIHLEAGSGTVTIAGASFAKCLNFKSIEFFGADFAYSGGCPYARGSYLESQFYSNSNKLSPAEKKYCGLMYRTELIENSKGEKTSEILEAYRKSLEIFLKSDSKAQVPQGTFSWLDFKSQYCEDLNNSFKNTDNINEESYAFMTLLPLCASLGPGKSFLAYLKTLEYTKII